MKKIITLFILSTFIFGCKDSNVTKSNLDIDTLSEKMETREGDSISFGEIIEQYKGKPIVVDIWASWCPDCIKGFPALKKLQQEFPNTVYLYLSYDRTPDAWKNAIDKYNLEGEHYLIRSKWKGGKFSEGIDLDWIPRYMVFDTLGNLAHYKSITADDQKLISTLKQLNQ